MNASLNPWTMADEELCMWSIDLHISRSLIYHSDIHIYYFQKNAKQLKFARELWERIRRECSPPHPFLPLSPTNYIPSPRTSHLSVLGRTHRPTPHRHVRSKPLYSRPIRGLHPLAGDKSRAVKCAYPS